MKPALSTRFKSVAQEGGVTEFVVWRVPQPVPPSGHGDTYRAVYAVDGARVIGFDNQWGKGDHCHLHGREVPYNVTPVDALVADSPPLWMRPRERPDDTTLAQHHHDARLACSLAASGQAGKAGQSDSYQGETLNFESPGAFFGRLTERRWARVTTLLGRGTMAVRELARRAGRDVKPR